MSVSSCKCMSSVLACACACTCVSVSVGAWTCMWDAGGGFRCQKEIQ